jgi:hypothetical protein
MAKTHKTPSGVNEDARPKSDEKSLVRNLFDIARGSGPEGVIVLGSIFCTAHYGRTDLSFLTFSLLAIWSLLAFRFLSRRRGGHRPHRCLRAIETAEPSDRPRQQ